MTTRLSLVFVVALALASSACAQPKGDVAPEWIEKVAALKPEEQIAEIQAKFRELYGPQIRLDCMFAAERPVEELSIAGMQYVEGVAPLAPLKKLKKLRMSGGKVRDLGPLKGMPLELLDCSKNQIASLEPLRGMPLEKLLCQGQSIEKGSLPDGFLAPAATWPRLKVLNCSGCRVAPLAGRKLEELNVSAGVWTKSGLTVLQGMPLKVLSLESLLVSDPAVQRGKPLPRLFGDLGPLRSIATLETLFLTENKGIVSLDPLKGLKLKHFVITQSSISTLEPLKAMKSLKNLETSNSNVSSVEPLKGLSLEALNLTSTRIADLSPLSKLPLTYLQIRNTPVRDLRPLKGLPLKVLDLGQNNFDLDLTPLAGSKLEYLNLGASQTTDLRPLRGLPIGTLDLSASAVVDLRPIETLPIQTLMLDGVRAESFEPVAKLSKLESVVCTPLPKGLTEALRKVPTLQQVNGKPAAEALK